MREHGYSQPLDTYELLSTKLAPPRPHPSLVSRGSLLARLDEGLQHKLTLLSAPAGFGKSTLVSEWIAAHSERQDPLSVAWVSLDAGDNDPVRFWRYAITACQVIDAAVGEPLSRNYSHRGVFRSRPCLRRSSMLWLRFPSEAS